MDINRQQKINQSEADGSGPENDSLENAEITRRGFFRSVAGHLGSAVEGAAAVVVIRELATHYFRTQHESVYGSLREPEFLITNNRVFGKVWTLHDHLKAENELLRSLLDRNTDAEADLNLRRTAAYSVTAERNFQASLEERHGKAIEYVQELFTLLTGKPLPDQVSLRVEEIEEEDVAGHSNFLTGEVVVEDAAYWDLLSVMSHEIGHLTNQHQENHFYCSWLENRPPYNEAQNLEEACAYLFQIAGTWAIEDPYVRNLGTASLNSYIRHFSSQYFEGEPEYHRLAVVLADNAVNLYGSPAEAYNTLARTPKVPVEVWDKVEATRALYETNKALQEAVWNSF